jgi:hypothetical protein
MMGVLGLLGRYGRFGIFGNVSLSSKVRKEQIQSDTGGIDE